MILNATNISKSFGSNEIIKEANFLVNEHEKVAIVGVNGAGKTTRLPSKYYESSDVLNFESTI